MPASLERPTMDFPAPLFVISVILALAGASAVPQAANATSRSTKTTKPHQVAALQLPSSIFAASYQPRNEGRNFLHKHDLQPIVSLRCLQEKQRNPNRPCTEQEGDGKSFSGPIDMGHFPNWQNGICNSNSEYFCDPANLLKNKEREVALHRLQYFNERMMVDCGDFDPEQDPHSDDWYNEHHVYKGRLGLEGHRPFNMAVVVADEWPSTERDPKSLQYFGRVIMAQWGLMPIYNGVDHHNNVNKNDNSHNQVSRFKDYNRNCPNAAVLFILPRYREVFLSSPSCKFICESRGGPEVVAATLAGLDRGGLQEAITTGIGEVEKILQVTAQYKSLDHTLSGAKTRQLMDNDTVWIWTLRLLYVSVIAIAMFFIVAFVYYVLLDKARHTRTSYSAMNDQRALQSTFNMG